MIKNVAKWFGVLCVFGYTHVAMAAPEPVVPDPGQRFLEQQKRLKEQQLLERRPSDIHVAPLQAPETEKGGACFTINTITLKDAVVLKPEAIKALVSPYEGSCMGLGEINQLIYAITNAYIDKGYVTTRVYIPPQNLKQGTLELVVVPGVVEGLELNENKTMKDRWRLTTAFPFMKDKLLNLKDIEQGLDQMNRLPSSHAALQLWPGEKAGGTRVSIKDTAEDPLRGYVSYDNGGQSATGIHRVTLGVEGDNLIGVNDSLALHYIGSNDTNALAFNGSVPYGYWTFSLDSSYSEYLSVIDSAAELFGTTLNHSAKADRVVWRGKDTKTSLYGVLNLKESSRVINEVALSPQPLTVLRFGGTHLWRMPDAVLTLDAAYSQGVALLGAIHDPANASSDTPLAQFHKLDGSVSYFKPVSFGAARSSLVWQYSLDTLYSSEQIIMGDSGTVRGFSGSQLSGDSGAYSRNEVTFQDHGIAAKLLPIADVDIQPYAFADAGYAYLKSAGDSGYLTGTGAGLRFSWNRLSADVALAVPVVASGLVEDDGFEIYANISTKLF